MSLSVLTQAQILPQIGARSIGLGSTGLTQNDVYAMQNNPGAFGAMDKSQVAINYQNRFLISELSNQTLAFGYHTKSKGNFGLSVQHYGFNLYREMQTGFTYATQLARRFYGGLSVNWHHIAIGENYGNKNFATASLGILGFNAKNVARARLADYQDERYPTTFGLGISYSFTKDLYWNFEAEKSIIHPLNLKSGIEYQLHEMFIVRIGANSYPFQSSFGFGVKLKRFQFDMASLWNATLGLSPSMGLKFDL